MSTHPHTDFEIVALRAQRESIGSGFWLFAVTTTLAICVSINWLLTRPEAYPTEQPQVVRQAWSRVPMKHPRPPMALQTYHTPPHSNSVGSLAHR